MSGVSSSVWGLLHTQPRGGTGAPSDWMLLFCWRTRFCLGQWAMRWASLVLRSVVFCSSLDYFQQICWNHFCYTVVVVLQVLGMFVYSSYFKLAHIGSLDHYVSFLLAPTTAKGPLLVMLTFRQKSKDLGSKGLFYFKYLPIYNWAPFLYWTEKALQTLFWGRELILFSKSSGGSVLRTSTFSEASFSEPLWLRMFSVWMPLLGLWSCFGSAYGT